MGGGTYVYLAAAGSPTNPHTHVGRSRHPYRALARYRLCHPDDWRMRLIVGPLRTDAQNFCDAWAATRKHRLVKRVSAAVELARQYGAPAYADDELIAELRWGARPPDPLPEAAAVAAAEAAAMDMVWAE